MNYIYSNCHLKVSSNFNFLSCLNELYIFKLKVYSNFNFLSCLKVIIYIQTVTLRFIPISIFYLLLSNYIYSNCHLKVLFQFQFSILFKRNYIYSNCHLKVSSNFNFLSCLNELYIFKLRFIPISIFYLV